MATRAVPVECPTDCKGCKYEGGTPLFMARGRVMLCGLLVCHNHETIEPLPSEDPWERLRKAVLEEHEGWDGG